MEKMLTGQTVEGKGGEIPASSAERADREDVPPTRGLSAPWYRQMPIVISLAAFLFSLATTALSIQRAKQQEIHNLRQELRGLVLQIADLPLRNVDLVEKYHAKPHVVRALRNRMATESHIVAEQAALIMQRIPELVTSSDYLLVASAFYHVGLLEKAKELRSRAIEVSSTANEMIVALRQLGGSAFQRNEVATGRSYFEDALTVWENPRFAGGRDHFFVAFTNCRTEAGWARLEAAAHACDAFRKHVAAAKRHAESISLTDPANRNSSLAIVADAERAGCTEADPSPSQPRETDIALDLLGTQSNQGE